MKRLWFSVLFLIVIFALTLWNVTYLSSFTSQITALLENADSLARSNDWGGAQEATEQAKTLWESREPYLYITLIHSDTDNIYTGFREVLEFIYCQEKGEYSAANARLIASLNLLHKMDEFTIQNIL